MLTTLKTSFLVISVLAAAAGTAGTSGASKSAGRALCQDTLPPLHTIRDEDISSVQSSFEDDTLVVILKNGAVHTYGQENWDLEDRDPATPKKIADAIRQTQKTFTRTEHAPEFPSGEEAWDQYIKEFCRQNKKVIKKEGSAEFIIQFTVHLKGQIMDPEVLLNRSHSDLGDLAIQALREGPAWVPATQNGRKVVCHYKQLVKLSW